MSGGGEKEANRESSSKRYRREEAELTPGEKKATKKENYRNLRYLV